jgi:predicted AAA+ superfamily ATPase
MTESSDGMVVTEGMLTEAAEDGDLESLTMWARQGVRVTTGHLLYAAAQGSFLEVVQCLVQQLGANVSNLHYLALQHSCRRGSYSFFVGFIIYRAQLNQSQVSSSPLESSHLLV